MTASPLSLGRAVLQLAKVRLTATIAMTSALGYVLAVGRLDWGVLRPLLGAFLLASGAAAWNQCQEAPLDARMDRTRGRPIPSGRLDRSTAALIGALVVLLGLYVLSGVSASAGGPPRSPWLALALGALAVAWYNGVYTPLKRKTAFAVVPGALLGALGPMIGFTAGGGDVLDPRILMVGAFFWVWQIPHFWLLALLYGPQQDAAGVPSPMRTFSRQQILRITFVWVCAAAAMGPVLLAAGGAAWGPPPQPVRAAGALHIPWAAILLVSSAWLALAATRLFRREEDSAAFKRLFMRVNLYGCAVMLCLVGGVIAP